MERSHATTVPDGLPRPDADGRASTDLFPNEIRLRSRLTIRGRHRHCQFETLKNVHLLCSTSGRPAERGTRQNKQPKPNGRQN